MALSCPSEIANDKSGAPSGDGMRRPYVLFLGRLNWKKGLDRLIPAMQQVTNADLLIAGNDEENYRPELEALARRCGVVDRVRFLGPFMGRGNGPCSLQLKFWRCRRTRKTLAMSFWRPWLRAVPCL